jgi:membrane-bound lytic murein transglycosylase D
MKKTSYIVLSALILLCGCTEKIFPIRGVQKTETPQEIVIQTTAPSAVEQEDTTITETVEKAPIEIQRMPIPEAWTKVEDDSLVVLESMSGELDSLLNSWYAQTYLMVDTTCTSTATNPIFSDTVYNDRLANLPCVVPMIYNQVVKSHIDRYASKLRHQVSYMLGMMEYYEPLIEQALDVYDVPNELKYLPVVESALNPVAVSRVGATGLWQFMYSTGKLYGLKQNSLVDDRRDPEKASWAAAKYLRSLYDRFGDWSLAIAAYNCGPGNVNKAIYRSGGKREFWDIYWYLPRETRGYLPAFIAANYIMTYHAEHGICPMESKLPLATDTIMVNRLLHFDQIVAVCDIDIETLRGLNPQYKENVIPGKFQPNSLRLPEDKIRDFILSGDSIYNYEREKYFSEEKVKELKNQALNTGFVIHKIRSGETLSTIARRYRVTITDLKRWNGLKSSNIVAGKTLKIYPR